MGMKKITIYLIGLPLLVNMLAGCNKFLDLTPTSSLAKENFFLNADDISSWNAGIYDGMQKTLSSRFLEWGEVRADNLEQEGTGTVQSKMLNNGLTSDMAQTDWADLYKVVTRCNTAIKYYPNVQQVDPITLNRFMGQAYAMRALMYFYAIRVWGDVPLITEPYEGNPGEKQFYDRAPVESVKTQIISDLTTAIGLLQPGADVYYINKGSAMAIKMEVEMWFKDYDNAIKTSDDIIALKTYSLVTNPTDFKNIFVTPDASKETMFNMYWSYVQDGTGAGACSLLASGSNTTNYKMQDSIYYALIDRNKKDARLWQYVDTTYLYTNGGRLPIGYLNYQYIEKTGKFNEYDPAKSTFKYYSNSQCDIRIPIIRFADVMLMRAEALNQKNRKPEAYSIVNQIRSRVGYNVAAESELGANPSTEKVETLILLERQLELFGEGKRWFDLIRTGRVLRHMDPALKRRQAALNLPQEGFGDLRKILWPLNTKVFESNPLLAGKQNPPYSE